MNLRLFRTYRWVARPAAQMVIGGRPPPLVLEPHDELQMEVDGQWVAVPVVEAEPPEHPQVVADRAREEAMAALVLRAAAGAQPSTPGTKAGSFIRTKQGRG